MFEQSFENEDRYTQQGRRSQSPYNDRRNQFRGQDDRFEDRYRTRSQDSDRRYTRPDYDSDLDIERPGQAHFGSRGGSDYGRDSNQDSLWQRSYRSQSNDRYGQDGYRGSSDGSSYGRGTSDWGRSQGDYGTGSSGRTRADFGRDYGTGSGMGHADWNRFGSDERDQSYGRQQGDWNEQRSRWPKSYKRSDERIKDDIHEELIRHGRIDASEIEVQVKDGEVTLTGQVSSRQDKRVAEEMAEKVLGVHDVQNQLRVKNQQQSQTSSATNRMSVAGQQTQDPSKTALNTSGKQ